MKAKEYYEKYFKNIKSEEAYTNNSILFFREILNEVSEIARQRKISVPSSMKGMFKEQQKKVDAVNRIHKKEKDCNIFVKNAFRDYVKILMPELKDLID